MINPSQMHPGGKEAVSCFELNNKRGLSFALDLSKIGQLSISKLFIFAEFQGFFFFICEADGKDL